MTPAAPPDTKGERYTPEEYVVLVRDCFRGHIDLDPASCAAANLTVQAVRYFSREDNGLVQPWHAGTCFLEPAVRHRVAAPLCSEGGRRL